MDLSEKEIENKVCMSKKSQYRLNQFPRQWNLKFDGFMQKLEFKRSKFDSCVLIASS